jgi:phosphatidate cytidylyltransferase
MGIGLVLGAVAAVTLFTVKVTFMACVAVVVGLAAVELTRALRRHSIEVPLVLVLAGVAAMLSCAYWLGEGAVLSAFALTAVALLAWRLTGGPAGYVRDVTAGFFTLAYLPLLGSFVALMVAAPDGTRRTLLYIVVTICSDIGGYFAGILFGRHPMAPVISPHKTWEGLAGSALVCLAAGAALLPVLLNGQVWQGLIIGAGAVTAATLGDLIESTMKRDLEIKDMGSVLPGHGGVLDRFDSFLVSAPVTWLLLLLFIKPGK